MSAIGPALGAALGAAFFLWIAGLRVVSPTQIAWVMQSDWRFQFLGWHFFRQEPWRWPPGLIEGYHHAPFGTAVGYTDSVPIAAFLLKPFHAWLPMPMQYLGIWPLIAFVLQGVFGALIARVDCSCCPPATWRAPGSRRFRWTCWRR